MIYLLHFSQAFKHARHYLGSADDVAERLEQHRRGAGARLPQVVATAGIEMMLTRTWEGGKKEERKLKNQKNSPRFCPICKAEKSLRRAA